MPVSSSKTYSNARRLWGFLPHEQKKIGAWTLILNVISNATDLLVLVASVPLLNLLTNPDAKVPVVSALANSWSISSTEGKVTLGFVLLSAIYALKTCVQVWIKRFTKGVKLKIGLFFTDQMYSAYLNRPYEWHSHQQSVVLTRNVSESRLVVDQLLTPVMALLSDLVLILLGFAFLFVVEPLPTLGASILVLMVAWYLSRRLSPKIRHLGTQRVVEDNNRTEVITHSLVGIREVKVLHLEDDFKREVSSRSRSLLGADNSYVLINDLLPIVLEFLAVIALSLLVIFYTLVVNSTAETLNVVVLFSLGVLRLVPSFARLLNARQLLKFGEERISRVVDDLVIYTALPTSLEEEQHELVTSNVSIELSDVSFHYGDNATEVLRNVSLLIPASTFVGIIGESGSGKTTLLDLLMGLLSPTGGVISFKGQDGKNIDRSHNNFIAYVPQDIYLFDLSLRDNLRLGLSEVDDAFMIECLSRVGLMDFYTNLSAGLDSKLGENGGRLSGGQKQRIGIARALCRKPSILVLDEATSALDDASERKVNAALLELSKNISIIAVSHRPTLLEGCSAIYEVSSGSLHRLI
jgi:ABC-type bacteriocin/lantibiotic exporter with double-glycine peptidase domain